MASNFIKKFAIENNLTVDYGYMYGKYKDFYISLKESFGSDRTLYIITNLGKDKENLKKVLSIFSEEELPKYQITNMKKDDDHLEFTFSVGNDGINLVIEFLDKFIKSYEDNNLDKTIYCPICNEKIISGQNISIVDRGGILTPIHADCFDKGKKKAKEEAIKEKESEKNSGKNYTKGILGAILFSLIYVAILVISFFFIQFILQNTDDDDNFQTILQYAPVLICLSACPLITYGYDLFKGEKGTGKYIIILWCVIISTILGTFFGFVSSLLLLDTGRSFGELLSLVGQLIACKDIVGTISFRWGFYLYILIGVGLAILSMVFKFNDKKETSEANKDNFDKLD